MYYFQPCHPGVVGEEGGRGEEELEDVGTGLFCLCGIKEGKVTILTKSLTRPALYLIFPLFTVVWPRLFVAREVARRRGQTTLTDVSLCDLTSADVHFESSLMKVCIY